MVTQQLIQNALSVDFQIAVKAQNKIKGAYLEANFVNKVKIQKVVKAVSQDLFDFLWN